MSDDRVREIRERDQQIEPWERHENRVCVECPECAFLFEEGHDMVHDGGKEFALYSCPNCAEARLLDRVEKLEAALDEAQVLAVGIQRTTDEGTDANYDAIKIIDLTVAALASLSAEPSS